MRLAYYTAHVCTVFRLPLSDEQMLTQLQRGEAFFFKLFKWQLIERQSERLGFDDSYFVTQVESGRGKLAKVHRTEVC